MRGRDTMQITRLDHLVLTVGSIEQSVDFYTRMLGMEKVVFGEGRVALRFGEQKINLHPKGGEFTPHAQSPTPGSADLCFIADCSIADIIAGLREKGVRIELGPVARTGAAGAMQSVYIRDPDLNLIEIATYRAAGA